MYLMISVKLQHLSQVRGTSYEYPLLCTRPPTLLLTEPATFEHHDNEVCACYWIRSHFCYILLLSDAKMVTS